MTAPQYWVPLPVGYFGSKLASALYGEFGPAGDRGFLVILAECGQQGYLGGPKGQVKLAWVNLALRLGMEAPAVQVLVERIAARKVLRLVSSDEDGCTAEFIDWQSWSGPSDPKAAARKAAERARKRDGA